MTTTETFGCLMGEAGAAFKLDGSMTAIRVAETCHSVTMDCVPVEEPL